MTREPRSPDQTRIGVTVTDDGQGRDQIRISMMHDGQERECMLLSLLDMSIAAYMSARYLSAMGTTDMQEYFDHLGRAACALSMIPAIRDQLVGVEPTEDIGCLVMALGIASSQIGCSLYNLENGEHLIAASRSMKQWQGQAPDNGLKHELAAEFSAQWAEVASLVGRDGGIVGNDTRQQMDALFNLFHAIIPGAALSRAAH